MIREPTEGRDDLGIPGADRGSSLPEPSDGGTQVERGDALADGVEAGPATEVEAGPATEGEPDVLPDVEVPEHQM